MSTIERIKALLHEAAGLVDQVDAPQPAAAPMPSSTCSVDKPGGYRIGMTVPDMLREIEQTPEFAEEMARIKAARSAPAPAPYPWGEVDLTGGMVQGMRTANDINGVVTKQGLNGAGNPLCTIDDRYNIPLSQLRPVPPTKAGQRVRVVSTAASEHETNTIDSARGACLGKDGLLVEYYDGGWAIRVDGIGPVWFHPADLMLLADEAVLSPDADADNNATAVIPTDNMAQIVAEMRRLKGMPYFVEAPALRKAVRAAVTAQRQDWHTYYDDDLCPDSVALYNGGADAQTLAVLAAVLAALRGEEATDE